MEVIVIKGENKIVKLLIQLAKNLGASVSKLNKNELEDFNFGRMINESKTGKLDDKKKVIDFLKENK